VSRRISILIGLSTGCLFYKTQKDLPGLGKLMKMDMSPSGSVDGLHGPHVTGKPVEKMPKRNDRLLVLPSLVGCLSTTECSLGSQGRACETDLHGSVLLDCLSVLSPLLVTPPDTPRSLSHKGMLGVAIQKSLKFDNGLVVVALLEKGFRHQSAPV